MTLKGKLVLIAADNNARALEIASHFIAAGATVVCCGPSQPVMDKEPAGNNPHFAVMKSLQATEIEILMETIRAQYQRLDILVYDSSPKMHGDGERADNSTTAIHRGLTAPLHFNRAANAVMQEQPTGGCIINICHTPQAQADNGSSHAAASGLANLCTSLAVEWAPKVRVNAITTSQADNTVQTGASCVYLASTLASYVTGANISSALG